MKPFPVNFKVAFTVVLTTLFVTLGVLNLMDRASRTEPSDGVYWEETGPGLRAIEVRDDGPGLSAGIRAGDALVSLNDLAISNLGQLQILFDRLGTNAVAIYRLKDASGDIREVSVMLGSRTLLTPKDGFRVLLAFLYLGIGLFVVLRSGRSPRAFHFYLICVTAFVVYLYSASGRWDGADKMVYLLSIWAPLTLPALFLHFCMRFPIDNVRGQSRAMLFYVPMMSLGLVQTLWGLGHLAGIGLPRTAKGALILDRVDLIYFCLLFSIGGLVLWKRRIEARDLTTRQQMKWVSYGTLAGIVPFTLIYVLPVLFGARASAAMELAMLSLGLIPLSFAYAIIHYRLLDVETIVRRGAAYFIASSMLLALYLFLVLVVGKALEWIAPEADFILISIAALGIALLFAPVRNRIQARLDRLFYKEQFDDRASLLDFARMLTSEISLGRLSRTILERLSKTFQVEKAALFLTDPTRHGWYRLTDELRLDVSGTVDPVLFHETDLIAREHPNDLPHVAGAHRLHRAHPALTGRGILYLQELNLHGRRIGLIGLGALTRVEHFSTEDLELLGALAGYAAMAIENANLYRSVEIKALELERLKIYTENIIESINVAVLVLDLEGTITSCNRAFEDLYGIERRQILGRRVEDLFPPDVISSIKEATGARQWILKGPSHLYKLYLKNRRSENLIVNMGVIPLIDATDQTTGTILVMDDITLKVRLEDQLLQVEKLSSIGLLAAGIAHEVNTPIAGISSYTQMLLKQTSDEDPRKPALEKIERQTFRAAEIVNGLLNFARMNGSEFSDLDINQLIRDSLSLLDHPMKVGRIQVDSHFDHSLPHVYGNEGKLQQVFINLFLNARDAMPSGGELKIRTSMNDSMVIVDILDTGVGISEGDIKRIYDPFFTTKTTGKGTGLGLAVTYGIIQEHGGHIFVDSTLGKGTHFRLKLPTHVSP